MKRNQLKSLGKQLLSELPEFDIKDNLLFKSPVEQLLKGIYFEESQCDNTAFTVTMFVMPMCIPRNHLVFNFGDRVRHRGGGDRWNVGMENLDVELGMAIKTSALPFLSRVSTLMDLVEVAESRVQNPRVLEVIGFALARAGQVSKAIEIFDKLKSSVDPNIAWQRDLAAQANSLKEGLIVDATSVQVQLSIWEDETIHNLHLDAFRRQAKTIQ